MSDEAYNVLGLSIKILRLIAEERVSPAVGNTALLRVLVRSVQHSRGDLSPEEIASFLHEQILVVARTL